MKFEEVFWRKSPSFLCEEEEVWSISELSSDSGGTFDLNQEMGQALIAPGFSSVSDEGKCLLCY